MENPIKVSVLMLAYNQEAYIDEAIRSVVLQQTSFPFELIIGDDHSSDGTLARCQVWQERYPEKIILHENACNLGLARNFIETYNLARGQYIAICEADDYWTDCRKLQIQADFMDAHPQYSMCFHRVVNFYEADGTKSLSNGGQKEALSLHDLALCNPITNVSVFYRRGLFGALPEWMAQVTSYDFVMHMLNAQHGDVYYMKRVMAVYRKLETSIWTGGDRRKRALISLKNRDLLLGYFQECNRETYDLLRKANARNCLNLSAYLKDTGEQEEADTFAQQARQYMPEWTEADLTRETELLKSSEQKPSLLKATMTACRKAVSKFLPLPRIKEQSATHLVFVPAGGLGNRMKAISAAVRLARESRSRLTILWFEDWGLGCRFDQLFRPIDSTGVSLRQGSGTDKMFFDRPRKRNLQLPQFFQRLVFNVRMDEEETTQRMYKGFDFVAWAQGKRAWLASHVYFMAKEVPDNAFDDFHPIAKLQQRIDETTADFHGKVIGVHIRRTDQQRSIQYSPTPMFIARMREEPEDTRFYLASDDEEVKNELRREFPGRILTLPRKAERGSLSGMEDALVELYTLSRTRKIIGSFGSTYSLTAAAIGRIQVEIIKKDPS